jgi:lipopolysaccharide transport protein LptA
MAGGRSRRAGTVLALVAWLVLPRPALGQGAETSPTTRANLAVARFAGDDLGSGNLPGVSTMLAAYLESTPALHVTPPDLVGAPPEVGDSALSAWAQAVGAEVFLTGQVLRFGEKLSIHTRLRSAQDGKVIETFVEEVPRDESRLEGIGALGSRIVGGIERALGISLSGAQDVVEKAADANQNTLRVGGDDAIEIQSEEIEVIPQDGGGRRIVFTTNVDAVQGSMRLKTDRLEAIYPAEAEGPARYVATGNVRMDEDRGGAKDDRQMLCDRAVFYQDEDRLVCTGNAVLREGSDRVRGKEIEILFASDVVKVRGGAFLNLGSAE